MQQSVQNCKPNPLIEIVFQDFNSLEGIGGEAGIRTLGTRKGTTVFETAPIDRSGTSPVTQAQALAVSEA
jgi:hypothetical protein